jgi:hypothetical protein
LQAARWPHSFVCNGTYHAFDHGRNSHPYLAEVQYRFSRRFNMCPILPRLPFRPLSPLRHFWNTAGGRPTFITDCTTE